MPLPPTLFLVAYARSYLCILEYVWYEIVAYITASTLLATSMSLKPADLPSTKARILVPFPILLVLSYEQVIRSKFPHYVSIYFFAFSAFAYEQALGCSKTCWDIDPLSHFFQILPTNGLHAVQIFDVSVRSPILSALPYDKDLRCPNSWIYPYASSPFFSSLVTQTGSCH